MLYKENLSDLFIRLKSTNVNIKIYTPIESIYLKNFECSTDILCRVVDANNGSYIIIFTKNKKDIELKYDYYEMVANFLKDHKIPFNIINNFNKMYHKCIYVNSQFKIESIHVNFVNHNKIDLSYDDNSNINIFKVLQCV